MSAALEVLRAAQQGDREACEQAVLENNGLIWSIVRRYYGRGVDPDDLYQLGCLGFLKAGAGVRLLLRHLFFHLCRAQDCRGDSPLPAGRRCRESGAQQREQAQTLYTVRERLRQTLGREPVLSELSEATGLAPEEIARTELATNAPESLQQEMADGLTLEGTLGTEAPEEGLVERIALREAIDHLPGKGTDDDSAALFQRDDPGTDRPGAGGIPGAGFAAGAPGAGDTCGSFEV